MDNLLYDLEHALQNLYEKTDCYMAICEILKERNIETELPDDWESDTESPWYREYHLLSTEKLITIKKFIEPLL